MSYRKGYRFELKVKKYLESWGYYVIRSAGSHGLADLIALAPKPKKIPFVLFIQCKLHGVLSNAEETSIVETAKGYGCIPVLTHKNNRGRLLIQAWDGKQWKNLKM